MLPPKHAKVLIAGGSVAGLALANSLEQTGIDYLVLEQWHEIAPDVGASIGIFPNGFRILDQLGCYNAITSLNEGRYAFDEMMMRNDEGNTIFKMDNASESFVERLGYEPVFVDRQMIIRILYENIKDKTRLLTSKGIAKVAQVPDGVRVETKDGTVFTGEILVGADGIHSTVRREMWRLADAERPGYFPLRERHEVATEYCCIFGISKYADKFQRDSAQYIHGRGHSYLVVSAPGNRIYWFLFKKLEKTARGLYEQVPRYTEAERDALAEKHANDQLGDGLCFGDLYRLRTVATLQALPEVVFAKWHYGRIITIGDAAHKFNPISGQGGNSALEDVAVLTNELFKLFNSKSNSVSFTDANITQAFTSIQAKRKNRAISIMKKSHINQSIQALDSLSSTLIAKYILPHANTEHGLSALLSTSRPAARLEMLPVPSRRHFDLFHDERPAKPLKKRVSVLVQLVAFGVFSLLIYLGTQNFERLRTLQTSGCERIETKPVTEIERLDHILNVNVVNAAGLIDWADIGHTLQSLYLLSWLTPILLIWFIEGHRYATRSSLVSWPAIFGVAMHFFSIATTAPAYCLASIWSTAGESYTTGIGRHIPESIAQALLPSIILGYVVPTALMFIPTTPHFQNLAVMWQFSAVFVTVLIFGFSKSPVLRWKRSSTSSESYSSDVLHLFRAYKVTFVFALLYHVFIVSYAMFSRNPTTSLARLILPMSNSPVHSSRDGVFSFMKQELLLSTVTMALYGMYSLFDLRRRGLITTKEAKLASARFLGAQVVFGPGAALVGLWWWREKKILGPGLEGGKR